MSSRIPSHRNWRRPLLPALFLAAGIVVVSLPRVGYGRVECDPSKDYPVNPASGNWMIIVQTYNSIHNPDGTDTRDLVRQQAHRLVLELRSKYDLPAYTFNRGKEERDKQEDELRRRREQQEEFLKQRGLTIDKPLRMKTVRIEDQWAVLIGGYKDMDAARKDLDRIRKLEKPSDDLCDSVGIATGDEKSNGRVERAYVNPFLRAFVVPNPTVTREKPREEADPFLKQLNAHESYSLFKSPKPWTLVVKEFHGANTYVSKSAPQKMLDLLLGRGGPDTLNASAMQAHEVVRVLRDHMKIESYVLHTRYGSIVCVGAYDSQEDPRLLQNKQLFTNFQMKDRNGTTIWAFMPIPTPMEVPKVR